MINRLVIFNLDAIRVLRVQTCVKSAQSWRHYASSSFTDAGQAQKLDKGNGDVRPHPARPLDGEDQSYLLMHPRYTKEYTESIKPTHRPPESVRASHSCDQFSMADRFFHRARC
jgi:hypothetical protein